MSFIKFVLVILILLSISGLILLFLWILGRPSIQPLKMALSEQQITIGVNIIIIFIMVITLIFVMLQLSGVVEQTKLLRKQVFVSDSLSMAQLGDRCLWSNEHGGDYNSYQTLMTLKETAEGGQTRDAILTQLKRVEDMYKSQDVMIDHVKIIPAVMKDDGTRTWANEETITAKNNLDHMYRWLWTERVKAAYFLGYMTTEKLMKDSKKWDDVFEALMHTLGEGEWSLFVRKISLITYTKLTRNTSVAFSPAGVFDFKGAIRHWNDNKNTIVNEKNGSQEKSETK